MASHDHALQRALELHAAVREANDSVNTDQKRGEPNRHAAFRLMPGADRQKGEGVLFDLAVATRTEGSYGADGKLQVAVVGAQIGRTMPPIRERVEEACVSAPDTQEERRCLRITSSR